MVTSYKPRTLLCVFLLFLPLPLATAQDVQFSTELADILADRCMRCHGGDRPRRGLRIDSYANLMRGSEDGEVIQRGDGANSLMIRKMKGEADGDRMPPNSNPLSDEVIAKFASWINAGAKFDGKDASLPLGRLAAASRLSQMSEAELGDEAVRQANQKWSLAFSGETPEMKRSEQFLVVSRKMTPELEEFAERADEEFETVAKLLGLPKTKLRSPLPVFFLPKRYDFAEFIQMVEKRDAASSTPTRYWREDESIGYLVVGPKLSGTPTSKKSKSKKKSPIIEDAELQSFITSMLLNRWGAPKWYADGLGSLAYEKAYRKSALVAAWKKQAPKTLHIVRNAREIFDAKMPTNDSIAATWAWAKYLARDSKRMNRLHLAISKGNAFERSFAGIYGKTPEELCDAWLKWMRPKKK